MTEPPQASDERDPDIRHSTDLVRRAARGEPGAFARLYEAHVDRVHRFVAYRVRDEAVAADLTQDVFVSALRALPRLGRASRFEPWLMRIARNTVANHWRSVSRRPRQVALEGGENGGDGLDEKIGGLSAEAAGAHTGDDAGRDTLERAELRVDHDALRAVIELLSEAKQDVIALRFGSGLTVRETAVVLGRSEGAIKKLQARALADIREAIR